MTLEAGTRLGRYEILSLLGRGGMGEVYKARDARLGRDVAIKVLPQHLTENPELRQRFEREARTISQLHHPHVCAVYDVGSEQGVDWLVMEYLEGETLEDRLRRGALAVAEVLGLGGQIAEAIEAAHRRGVVHRDLKPGNVMLTASGAKVLDFGLALEIVPRAATTATRAETLQAAITEEGTLVGTMPYMAPEQLQGKPADVRTDLWALGCVLYEMTTGERPFRGESKADLIGAILGSQPVPPTRKRPLAPERLDWVLKRCLEKDPERRWQSARDVAMELEEISRAASTPPSGVSLPAARPRGTLRRALTLVIAVLLGGGLGWWLWHARSGVDVGGWRERLLGGVGPVRIDSLAVLPLENLSGDPEQEYFADGMTDALIADLAQIHSIRVISRTSVMRYKGTRKPLPEIGRELSVKAIVDGSVMRSGDRVRITSQLVEAATDRHLWARSYERDLRDVLGLQSEVARAIAEEIQATLTLREKDRLARSRPVSPAAYDAYLRGRYYWNQRTTEAVRKGIELFEEAIAKDPTYALAYAGLADSYLVIGHPNLHPKELYERARRAALNALELDPELAEAYTSLGDISPKEDWNVPQAERNFRRAIELSPSYATAHLWYGSHLSYWGRHEEALRELEKARELDPLSTIIRANFGRIYYNARQYDKAIEYCLESLEMEPGYPAARFFLGLAYQGKGMYEEAVRELEKAIPSIGRVELMGDLGHAYARAGEKAEAMKVLHEMEQLSKTEYVSAMNWALVYVGLGQTDEALEYLSLAVEERAWWLFLLGTDPRLDPLRSDPRFANLKRRVGLWPD